MKLDKFEIKDCMKNTLEASLFWIGGALGLIIGMLGLLLCMVGLF
jgi:hypothetical protein